MAAPVVKHQFKCPEGRYVLHSEKTLGLVPFAMRRTTRLTIATLHGGEEEGMYMVYNVGDYLHVTPFDSTEKVTSTPTSSDGAAAQMIEISMMFIFIHTSSTHYLWKDCKSAAAMHTYTLQATHHPTVAYQTQQQQQQRSEHCYCN